MTSPTPSDRSPTALATTYFDAWRARDFDRFESVLADDVTFLGPIGTAAGKAECRAGIEGMSHLLDDVVVTKIFEHGDDVVTWFELHPKGIEPVAVANWSHVTDGRIDRVQVTFDPRPLLDR